MGRGLAGKLGSPDGTGRGRMSVRRDVGGPTTLWGSSTVPIRFGELLTLRWIAVDIDGCVIDYSLDLLHCLIDNKLHGIECKGTACPIKVATLAQYVGAIAFAEHIC